MKTRKAELTYEAAKEMYEGSIASLKAVALATYPELAEPVLPTTFEEVCKIMGESPQAFADHIMDTEIQTSIKKFGKIALIVRCLNGTWKPNYSNKNEQKWHIWWEYSASAQRFVFCDVYYCSVVTGVGARLV